LEHLFEEKLKAYQRIGGATMRNKKSLVLIVATVMLFSFAAVPPAQSFVGIAALGAIIAATFASAVVVNEAVVKPNTEPIKEHSASKQKTKDKIEALNKP
jgi:uncharacterized membrane protein YbaN (DUF454 family)